MTLLQATSSFKGLSSRTVFPLFSTIKHFSHFSLSCFISLFCPSLGTESALFSQGQKITFHPWDKRWKRVSSLFCVPWSKNAILLHWNVKCFFTCLCQIFPQNFARGWDMFFSHRITKRNANGQKLRRSVPKQKDIWKCVKKLSVCRCSSSQALHQT